MMLLELGDSQISLLFNFPGVEILIESLKTLELVRVEVALKPNLPAPTYEFIFCISFNAFKALENLGDKFDSLPKD